MTTECPCEKILEIEHVDALLPTIGGQTALNLAVQLDEAGVLDRHGVKLIGANMEAIHKAEDRQLFATAIKKIGLGVPQSGLARFWNLVLSIFTSGQQIVMPVRRRNGCG